MKTNEKPNQKILNARHDNPSNWKWGILYYNKEDKRIFSPKKFKYLGWTVNFANPYSILALLGIVFLIIIVYNYLKT